MKKTNISIKDISDSLKKIAKRVIKAIGKKGEHARSSSARMEDDENKLRKLRRSELLEIILMLKENEKSMEQENEDLKEELKIIKQKIDFRKTALEKDDTLGNAATELADSFYEFRHKAAVYYALLEESGENAVEGKAHKGYIANENK